MHIDTFSGKAADLKKNLQTSDNVLRVIESDPRLSTWDMSEEVWLREIIEELVNERLILEDSSELYPWHRWALTPSGVNRLNKIGRGITEKQA